MSTYEVKSGDYLGKIARNAGVTVEQIVEWNKEKYPSLETNPSLMQPGWELQTSAPTPIKIDRTADTEPAERLALDGG